MKLLSLLVLVLLLAALLRPAGHGARRRAGTCPPLAHPVPVQVIRSPKSAQAPKIVRALRKQGVGK